MDKNREAFEEWYYGADVSRVLQAFPLTRISTHNGNPTADDPYFYLWHDGRNPILDGEFSSEQLRAIADYVDAANTALEKSADQIGKEKREQRHGI